jgi:hypothetical protein
VGAGNIYGHLAGPAPARMPDPVQEPTRAVLVAETRARVTACRIAAMRNQRPPRQPRSATSSAAHGCTRNWAVGNVSSPQSQRLLPSLGSGRRLEESGREARQWLARWLAVQGFMRPIR